VSGPARTRPDHAARRDRVRAALAAHDADRLLVTSPSNVRYLSGFAGSNGQVIVGADGAGDRLITDERYTARAASEAPDLELVLSRDPFTPALSGATTALAVEADHLVWSVAERLRVQAEEAGLEVVATTGIVAALRATKDDHEVGWLARACAITTSALAELLTDRAVVGATERELATWLERRFVDLGADGVAFPSIVASGPNGAVPHHAPTDRPLEDGDLLTVDCGAEVAGYHADCTRTVAVGAGEVPGQLLEVHDLVAQAAAAGRAAAGRAPGGGSDAGGDAALTAGDIDAAARSVIEEAGYGDAFVHGTGHGVGLEVHEAPAVARGSSAAVGVGTVLTVEPGVYLPGVGGVRIEDTVVVTSDGVRVLTDLSRSMRLG
jgi:Xaa-Pro aminopeptidase